MSAPVTISANNTPPTATINAPAPGTRWKVDDLISFLGSATDPQQGTLPGSALSWELVLQHCPSNCHQHQLQTWPGVASGSFAAPDHEYPSYLELRLTATDAGGLTDTKTLRLDPKTVVLSFESAPAGLQLTVGGSSGTTPFTRTVIEGSNNSVSAPSPQTFGGTDYEWVSWSDGGAQSHNVVASGSSTYTAAYAGNQPPLASASGAPTTGPTPLTVNFYGSGSSDPEGGPLTYAWELDGDGAFDDSTVVSPTHTYTQPGTYQARLRVTDEQNQSATSVPITISANTTPTDKPPVQLMCPKGQYLAQYFAKPDAERHSGVHPLRTRDRERLGSGRAGQRPRGQRILGSLDWPVRLCRRRLRVHDQGRRRSTTMGRRTTARRRLGRSGSNDVSSEQDARPWRT
jgi:PKD domain